MSDLPTGAAHLAFDGSRLRLGRVGGRVFLADGRCFAGVPVRGAHARVCALADPDAALSFDHPEIQQVRRDVLAWWIPMLGDNLVCLTTLALDESRFAGAITVTHRPPEAGDDPFARIFPATSLHTDLFCLVPPPPGPVIERYAGVPWPGGSFDSRTLVRGASGRVD